MDPIEKKEGPCVILAGAGTGKTYAIVDKIKYLIENGIYDPERIVCITFSNEAANNLLIRVKKALDLSREKEPVVRTFHAFSADLLRKYGDKIGLKSEFNILTPEEAKVVLHSNLKIQPYYCHKYIGSIGIAKDLGISFESVKEFLDGKLKEFKGIDLDKRLESLQFELQTLYLRKEKDKKKELLREIYRVREIVNLKKFVNAWNAYEKIKERNHSQDYSDLNRKALGLLKEHPEIANDFDYVIVDEFQDTNKVQLDLLKSLSSHRNITVVGDLNQSIYRFRGAYRKNFHEFREYFGVGERETFNLDKSFRSPNKVLKAAHDLILNNYVDKDECFEVKSKFNREGDKIEVFELKNAKEEARKVVELVERELERGEKAEEICIMFRTHQQGRIIKKALEFKGIDFCSVTKNSLLKHSAIKTAIDYLSILEKLKNKKRGGEQAWWDLMYQLDFLEKDLIQIGKYIRENKSSDNISVLLLNSLDKLPLSNAGRLSTKILVEKIKRLIPSTSKEAHELLKDVYDVAGLVNNERTREEKEIMLNLHKFYELVKSHGALYSGDLLSFISYLDALKSLNIEIEGAELEKLGVRLMTLHSTKGLEYNTVIITNMAQKRFPMEKIGRKDMIPLELSPELEVSDDLSREELESYVKDFEIKNQLSEERRLCYVAFTRTKKKLVLTYAQEYGGKKFYPSRFLNEIKYKQSSDVDFFVDNDEKYVEPSVEIKPASKFGSILNSKNFDDILIDIVKSGEVGEKPKVSAEEKTFSPSALLTFSECQKKYEYQYVYNMPEMRPVSWPAIRLGSFVHLVLDKGVKSGFRSLKEFVDYARELSLKEEWDIVDFDDAEHLIKIFFERNKEKYSDKSKTEQLLKAELDGFRFVGFADRIDFSDSGMEIVDYKTGKSAIKPKNRNWQLGYYALAAGQYGKVKKVTLDMLKQEKPLEFEIDGEGNARAVHSGRMEEFNINEVKEELVETAKQIMDAYEKGFKPCPIEKNCEFCNEYIYGL